MTGKKPTEAQARPLQVLIGLLISNGPGAISAQGAKGAVAADGPQTPGRVQLNKAMVGFLTHTGYSHGGNGFEGMAFLLDQFKDKNLEDPTDPKHGLDLKAIDLSTPLSKAKIIREMLFAPQSMPVLDLLARLNVPDPYIAREPTD
jgi:hypothetical protein